jgi:hypothetical protein
LGRIGRPRKARTGFEKAEIAAFLREGERISGSHVLVRPGKPGLSAYSPSFDYTLFLSITSLRGYYVLLAAEGGEPRVFRSFDRLLRMLRELGYLGQISVYDEGDPRRPAEPRGATKRRPGERLAVADPSSK